MILVCVLVNACKNKRQHQKEAELVGASNRYILQPNEAMLERDSTVLQNYAKHYLGKGRNQIPLNRAVAGEDYNLYFGILTEGSTEWIHERMRDTCGNAPLEELMYMLNRIPHYRYRCKNGGFFIETFRDKQFTIVMTAISAKSGWIRRRFRDTTFLQKRIQTYSN